MEHESQMIHNILTVKCRINSPGNITETKKSLPIIVQEIRRSPKKKHISSLKPFI
jgi:hypothetical protein